MSELRRRGRRFASDVYTKTRYVCVFIFFLAAEGEETDRKGATEREVTAILSCRHHFHNGENWGSD